MKKQITITIVSSDIITNPPQQEKMQIQIEGLLPIESIHILLSTVSQLAANELPKIIKYYKAAVAETINPMGQTQGEA